MRRGSPDAPFPPALIKQSRTSLRQPCQAPRRLAAARFLTLTSLTLTSIVQARPQATSRRCGRLAAFLPPSAVRTSPSPLPLLPSHPSVYRNVRSVSMSVNKITLPRRRKELPRATGIFAFAFAAGATALILHRRASGARASRGSSALRATRRVESRGAVVRGAKQPQERIPKLPTKTPDSKSGCGRAGGLAVRTGPGPCRRGLPSRTERERTQWGARSDKAAVKRERRRTTNSRRRPCHDRVRA